MKKPNRIAELFDEIEKDFPDKSMAWLMQMTCDRYEQETGHEIDHGDVAVALADVYDPPEE